MKSQLKSRKPRRHPAPLLTAPHTPSAVHGSRIANNGQPFSNHSSLITRHCLIQSLAKHNRKPLQMIEKNISNPNQSLVFVVLFAIPTASAKAAARCVQFLCARAGKS
jgi:hypothetical protein